MATTGMIVDIKGQGPASEEGKVDFIAFRTDMDGLKMEEVNDLPYKSQT